MIKKEVQICIYKITSPSGAVYIGQTVNLVSRKRAYKNLFCKSQRRLYRSFVKHGYDSHKIEVVEFCEKSALDSREIYWVSFFDSCNNGMNLNHGGSQYRMSEETKSLISIKRKLNQTGVIGRKGKDHYNYGKKATDEIRMNLSLSHKGLRLGSDNNMFKGFINAYKDGILIGKYEGVNDAANKLNLQHPNISKVILGKRKTTGGYTFKRLAA